MPVPTGPKGRFFVGNLNQFRGDRLGFFTNCVQTYGNVVPFRLGPRRCLLISDPELIEQVFITNARQFIKHFALRMYKPILGNGLVTAEGDLWRRQRKLSAPAFQPAQMAGYAQVMVAATDRMLEAWPGGDVRDVHVDMTKLTLEIACKTLFGAGAAADAAEVGQALHVAMEVIGSRLGRVIRSPLWLPTQTNRRLRKATRTLDRIVTRFITPVGASSVAASSVGPGRSLPRDQRSDLLTLLLRQRDDDGSVMTARQLLDEARTLFVAGHETTALTLTYALYLLAENPAVQQSVQAEIDAVLPGGRSPAFADLPLLRGVRNVVYESLRLYPPADVLGRQAIADCTIQGVQIRKGTSVFASTWVMHRDGRFFDEPERFKPARWTDEFEKSLPRFAYFPFGGGPRFCIGQSFAVTEATLALAAICQRFAFAPAAGYRLELWPAITLRPRNGVRLMVTRRRDGRTQSRREGIEGSEDRETEGRG